METTTTATTTASEDYTATSRMSKTSLSGAALVGFAAGNLASFVKWGAEKPFPPRLPGSPDPTIEILHSLGVGSDMTYRFAGHALDLGSIAVHHLFSITFAMLYCCAAEVSPSVAAWRGAAFGLGVAILFHGLVLPSAGWARPLWHSSIGGQFSETLGSILWAWTIELVRRDCRRRSSGGQPPRAPHRQPLFAFRKRKRSAVRTTSAAS